MAACLSNRSPSPISKRPNPNSNSRNCNTERENVIRKSFNGNPFPKPSVIPHSHGRSFNPSTPANSPADYARRSSFRKESTTPLHDYEHKENERDPNSRMMRAKSPSVLRGTKNFMSPTISAASKINASPRKKVLAERNDAIRASASLSDGQFHFYSVNSLDAAEDNAFAVPTETNNIEAVPSLTAAYFHRVGNDGVKFSKNDHEKDRDIFYPASGVTNVEEEDTAYSPFEATELQGKPDLAVLSPEVPLNYSKFESSTLPDTITNTVSQIQNASSSQSTLSPFNADPSILPYDPKTNYLSPRPKFLHYKPNPRIEVYLNKGKQLEDDFTSETSSGVESTAETQSENSLQEYEDASSVEMAAKEPTPKSCEPHATTPHLLHEAVDSKAESKQCLLSKSKVIALLFVFSVAFLSILAPHSPVIRNAVFEDQSISKIYHHSHMVAEFVKENLTSLFQNARVWPDQFVNYLSRMSHGLREVDKNRPLQFNNLSALHDDGFHVVEQIELGLFHGGEQNVGLIKEIGGPFIFADSNVELFPKMESNIELEEYAPSAEGGEVIKVDDSGAEILKENSRPFTSAYEKSQYDPQPVGESEFLVEEPENQIAGQTAVLEPKHLEAVGCTCGENDIVSDIQYELHGDIEVEDQLAPPSLEHEGEIGRSSCNQFESGQAQEESGNLMLEMSVGNDIVSDIQYELHSDIKAEDQLTPPSLEHKGESDFSSCNQFESGQVQEESGNLMLERSAGNFQIFEALGLGDKFLAPSNLGVCLLLMTLLGATLFTYMKLTKGSLENAAPLAKNEFPADEFVSKPLPVASNMESSFHKSPSSCSGPIEVDMHGESCPSELSSFQKSSSYSNKKGLMGADEAQSQERKSRRNYTRDSLASSSDYTAGSISYGSFTTYSIIHLKDGDDDVVTPVRRSSRIRDKVTSP
ncbi:hypothetical protein Ancab_017577 [Ancistrocladus abbreviatus]